MTGDIRRSIHSELDASRTVLESTLFCQNMGFEETSSRMVATAVSELVRNVLKYAGSGECCLRMVKGAGISGVEVEVTDHGPGIPDCEAAMQDHFSSSGTLGMGLPGVRRLMDEFSLESAPGKGTRVTARKWL
jgi:serine/threonine-protein kinase RsbT